MNFFLYMIFGDIMLISFRDKPTSRIAESHFRHIFTCSENCQIVFHSGCTILPFPPAAHGNVSCPMSSY